MTPGAAVFSLEQQPAKPEFMKIPTSHSEQILQNAMQHSLQPLCVAISIVFIQIRKVE